VETIVIISKNKEQNSPLTRLVKVLFPDCKVALVPRENGKTGKVAKKGGQYERRRRISIFHQ